MGATIGACNTWQENALFAKVPLAVQGIRMGTPAIYKGWPRAKVRVGQMRERLRLAGLRSHFDRKPTFGKLPGTTIFSKYPKY